MPQIFIIAIHCYSSSAGYKRPRELIDMLSKLQKLECTFMFIDNIFFHEHIQWSPLAKTSLLFVFELKKFFMSQFFFFDDKKNESCCQCQTSTQHKRQLSRCHNSLYEWEKDLRMFDVLPESSSRAACSGQLMRKEIEKLSSSMMLRHLEATPSECIMY